MPSRPEPITPDEQWLKYFDYDHHLIITWLHVLELGLHKSRPKRILDIGTGAGYFPWVCEQLGHTVVAADLDQFPVFNAIISELGIDRLAWEVQPFTPAPDFGRQIDLLTAFAMDFDLSGCSGDERWHRAEWKYFLEDMAKNRLSEKASIYLGIKRFKGGTGINAYDADLFDYFRESGASLPRKCRVVYRELSGLRNG